MTCRFAAGKNQYTIGLLTNCLKFSLPTIYCLRHLSFNRLKLQCKRKWYQRCPIARQLNSSNSDPTKTHKDTTKEEVEMISMCAIKNQNINVGAQSLASTQMLM